MEKRFILYLFSLFTLTSCFKDSYSVEGGKVYYNYLPEESINYKRKLVDADAKTFKSFDKSEYAHDASRGYYKGKPMKIAHPKTFKPISEFYAADRMRGYYKEEMISGAYGKSLRPLFSGYHYSTDGHDVFFESKPLHVSDVKNFKLLDEKVKHFWGTDGKYYYFMNFKVPSEDYQHLTIVGNYYYGLSKDSKYVYIDNRRLNFNKAGKKVIDTIDAASFYPFSMQRFSDKFGMIVLDSGRIPKKEGYSF